MSPGAEKRGRDRRGTAGPVDEPVLVYYRSFFSSTDRVLDLGCGQGAMLTDGWLGIDMNLISSRRGQFVCGDLDSPLPLQSGVFDGVLCKDIIEHLFDPQEFLNEAARVSKPGARLVLVTPRAIPRAVWADHTHIRGFTREALARLLQMTGWEIRSIGRMGGLPLSGRLGLTSALPTIMKIPGLGHRFGTNWQAVAVRAA